MVLKTIKPRLASVDTNRVKVLDTKAGVTAMPGGRAWQATRQRVALAHGYRCICGAVWRSHIDQIDHETPREQGGSNADSNLRPMCKACHDAKSADEARVRAGR